MGQYAGALMDRRRQKALDTYIAIKVCLDSSRRLGDCSSVWAEMK